MRALKTKNALFPVRGSYKTVGLSVAALLLFLLAACSAPVVTPGSTSNALVQTQPTPGATSPALPTYSDPYMIVTVHPYADAMDGKSSPSFVNYIAGTTVEHDLATLYDPSDLDGASIAASIYWGDNSTPTQSACTIDESASTCEIMGAHAYSKTGTYTVTVVAQDSSNTSFGKGVLTVVPAFTLTVQKKTGVVGQAIQGLLATGTDPNEADSLRGTIDWGDGSPLDHILFSLNGLNYQLNGNHTYTQRGNYTITVSLTGFYVGTVQNSAQATIAPAFRVTARSFSARSGTAFQLKVGTVTSVVPTQGFIVDIAWGDSNGIELTLGNGSGSLPISAGHTYSQPGTYTLSITVRNPATGEAEGAFGTVTVS